MKRTKFLVGALVLSMGLVGTGYALWSDSLQIDSTVSTGAFNVNFAEPTVSYYYDDDDRAMTDYNPTTHKFVNMKGEAALEDQTIENDPNNEVDNENDKITFNVSRLVPGSIVRFDTTIHNTGDVAAVLDTINVQTKDVHSDLKDDLLIDIVAWDNTKGEWVPVLDAKWVKIADVEKTVVINKDKLQNVLFLNAGTTNAEAAKEDTIQLGVMFKLNNEANNTTQSLGNDLKGAKVEFTLNFNQHVQPQKPEPRDAE